VGAGGVAERGGVWVEWASVGGGRDSFAVVVLFSLRANA